MSTFRKCSRINKKSKNYKQVFLLILWKCMQGAFVSWRLQSGFFWNAVIRIYSCITYNSCVHTSKLCFKVIDAMAKTDYASSQGKHGLASRIRNLLLRHNSPCIGSDFNSYGLVYKILISCSLNFTSKNYGPKWYLQVEVSVRIKFSSVLHQPVLCFFINGIIVFFIESLILLLKRVPGCLDSWRWHPPTENGLILRLHVTVYVLYAFQRNWFPLLMLISQTMLANRYSFIRPGQEKGRKGTNVDICKVTQANWVSFR